MFIEKIVLAIEKELERLGCNSFDPNYLRNILKILKY